MTILVFLGGFEGPTCMSVMVSPMRAASTSFGGTSLNAIRSSIGVLNTAWNAIQMLRHDRSALCLSRDS